MNTPLLALPLPTPIPTSLKKKRVLLVDTSTHKRELRAEIMRKLGIDVDCAADIGEAVSWWRADLYNLVLIDAGNDIGQDGFCEVIRNAIPPQQMAFLVGKPDYLAGAAKTYPESSIPANDDAVLHVKAAILAASDDHPLRWGILEASRRISEVRSASVARTQAMRTLPAPPRDSEARPLKRVPAAASLDDLLREELR